MKNRIKAPKSITIGVLTVLTIVFWIGFEVYRVATRKPVAIVTPEIIEPLSPTLDLDAISKLQQRVHLSETEIGNTTVRRAVEQIDLVSTESATPIPATDSGEDQ